MKTARFTEDLSALARRGALSEVEARRLDVYLNASEDARILHDIGIDYDRMPTDEPGDEALLARVSTQALERRTRRRRSSRRLPLPRAVAWLAAGLLLASAAGASAWRYRPELSRSLTPLVSFGAGRHSPGGRPAEQRGSGAARPAISATIQAQDSPSRVPEAAVPSAAQGKPRSEPVDPRPRASGAKPSAHDAPTLFSVANTQRKSGDLVQALASYAALREVFPASPEARVSLVVSARLELRSGDSVNALKHFDRYLVTEPNGALTEEALEGKARALRGLGRLAEEQNAWRLLLQRFPKSVHGQTARERLPPQP